MELSNLVMQFAASPMKLLHFDDIVTNVDCLWGQSCTGY